MNTQAGFLVPLSGTFFRIVFARAGRHVLRGATSSNGRYHHDEQQALYMSSRPDWAYKAIETYIRPDDPPRCILSIEVQEAVVVDIRDHTSCYAMGINPADSDVPWQPQLAAGIRPATWNVSDRARTIGADGLIYTARTKPDRWHVVLFRWNAPGAPTLHLSDSRQVV